METLKATAALTTLRITSTVSHPHRALCWFPATWLTPGESQEQRPQVSCHPPAAVQHPPHHDEPPNQLPSGEELPPAPAASPGQGPCFSAGASHPTAHLGTWLPLPGRRPDLPQPSSPLSPSPVPGCLLSFLPSASSPFAHHPRVPSIRLSYRLAAINLRNRRSIVRRTSAQRPIRIPIRC